MYHYGVTYKSGDLTWCIICWFAANRQVCWDWIIQGWNRTEYIVNKDFTLPCFFSDNNYSVHFSSSPRLIRCRFVVFRLSHVIDCNEQCGFLLPSILVSLLFRSNALRVPSSILCWNLCFSISSCPGVKNHYDCLHLIMPWLLIFQWDISQEDWKRISD